MFVWNISWLSTDYLMLYPRRQISSEPLLSEQLHYCTSYTTTIRAEIMNTTKKKELSASFVCVCVWRLTDCWKYEYKIRNVCIAYIAGSVRAPISSLLLTILVSYFPMFGLLFYPEEGGSPFFWNVCILQPYFLVSYVKTQRSPKVRKH
jgi:hypothetical protein